MQPGRYTERRTTKAANYGAKVGETIAGRLVRGAGGRFGSGDAASTQSDADATIAQNRATPRGHPAAAKPKTGGRKRRAAKPRKARAKKPKTARAKKPKAASKVQQKRQQEREAVFNAMKDDGLNRAAFDAITALADGAPGHTDMLSALADETGLAELTADGTYQLTPAGRSYVRAANRGNVDQAKRALIKGRRAVEDATTTKEAGHTGVMLAFFLPALVAQELTSQTATAGVTPEPTDDLHLTLAYLGKTADLADSKYQILAGAERYARWAPAVMGTISGVGRFQTDEGDGTNALYASFDAPDLSAWRDNLIQTLADQGGILPAANHGYTPHITLAYLPTGTATPTLAIGQVPVTFDTLTVAWGDERIDFPLIRSSPMVFKDHTGRLRWVLFSSTAYRDRDKEIVSTKALTDDVARADSDGNYGPLRWWHMPGVDIGDCDFNAISGRVLVESGTFRNEAVGQRVKEHADQLRASLGFHHPATEPDGDGVFWSIKRFERSLLPAEYASNPYTMLPLVVQEGPMDQPKKDALKALLGDDKLLEQLLTQADATTKAAEQAGVTFKEAGTDATVIAGNTVTDSTAGIEVGDDDIAVGDLSPAEYLALQRQANQPLVDALGTFASALVGQTTKAAGIETRLAAVETTATKAAETAAAVPDLATQLAQARVQLTTAQLEIATLKGDVPKSIKERQASQSDATVRSDLTEETVKNMQPGNSDFMTFVFGQQPQQGA